jgi:hypothetical protein
MPADGTAHQTRPAGQALARVNGKFPDALNVKIRADWSRQGIPSLRPALHGTMT